MQINFEDLIKEAEIHFSRSGGKGGQNVNKVETKVELKFNITNSQFLDQEIKDKLIKNLAKKIDHEGFVHVSSSKYRHQHANRLEAQKLLIKLIESGLIEKKKRKPTQISQAVKTKRLESKKKHKEKKESRKEYYFVFFIFFISNFTYCSLEKINCAPQIQITQDCVRCNLINWSKKVFSLKEYPMQMSSLPDSIAYQKNILTKDEFFKAVFQMGDVIKNECKINNNWLGNKSIFNICPNLSNIKRSLNKEDIAKNFIFKPFAQRLIMPIGSNIAIWGDLHGAAHSLLRDLLKLVKLKYLDNNFRIIKKNFVMLFLGDYVDGGIYGTEVIYTLARLKIANPKNVFIVRGNHEDYEVARHFKKKFHNKLPKDMLPNFLDELNHKFSIDQEAIFIYRLYDMLPVVLYLGSGLNDNLNFMQCCHGGIELGYNPQKLLSSSRCINFEFIRKFNRKDFFYNKLTKEQQNLIKQNFDPHFLCADLQDIIFHAPVYKLPNSEQKIYLGFMWNDFYVNPKVNVGPRKSESSQGISGWVYGQELTQAILKWGDSKRCKLKGILRAHQHNNETGGPMLDLLCCSRGFLDIWKNKLVYTFLSSADSKLDNSGQACFTYDSFVILQTARNYKDWKFIHYSSDISYSKKEWKMETYC